MIGVGVGFIAKYSYRRILISPIFAVEKPICIVGDKFPAEITSVGFAHPFGFFTDFAAFPRGGELHGANESEYAACVNTYFA